MLRISPRQIHKYIMHVYSRAEYIVYKWVSKGRNLYFIHVCSKGRVYSIHFSKHTCAICIYMSAICISYTYGTHMYPKGLECLPL